MLKNFQLVNFHSFPILIHLSHFLILANNRSRFLHQSSYSRDSAARDIRQMLISRRSWMDVHFNFAAGLDISLFVRVMVSSRWKSVPDWILAREHANGFDTFVSRQLFLVQRWKPPTLCSSHSFSSTSSPSLFFFRLQFLSPNALTLTLVFFFLFVSFSLLLLSFLPSLSLFFSISLSLGVLLHYPTASRHKTS